MVPVYNERENLEPLVRQILAHEGCQVMVVDDQSPDGTGQVADSLAREFPDRVNIQCIGPGSAGSVGPTSRVSASLERDVDLVCQMDADFSHDPKFLPDLVAGAADHDLVIGSRYLNGISVVNWPLHRLILSTFANRYITVQ